jgi:hypothetical protein
MKKQLKLMLLGFLVAGTIGTSCKKDKVEENEEEVITTMKLTFVPVGGGATLTYQFDDPDGPGGTAPTKDEIVLAPSKTYAVTVQLLNKTVNPAEDITLEVDEEAEAHRFYYLPQAGSNITIAGFDNDANGVPVGISSVWTTGAAATGKVKVTLRHYPATPPNKASNDPVDSPKSSTDIEVEFNTKIQ